MSEIHILATGLVQGIGFRATIKRHAAKYQIKGYARNLSDGSVEICAQGTPHQLDLFVKCLQENPGMARIDSFEIKQKKAEIAFDSFEI